MKKRTKFLAVVVATVMAASTILTGCGSKENTGNEKHTIGVILYGKDDAFGAAEYAYINSAAEALDVDIKWALYCRGAACFCREPCGSRMRRTFIPSYFR